MTNTRAGLKKIEAKIRSYALEKQRAEILAARLEKQPHSGITLRSQLESARARTMGMRLALEALKGDRYYYILEDIMKTTPLGASGLAAEKYVDPRTVRRQRDRLLKLLAELIKA